MPLTPDRKYNANGLTVYEYLLTSHNPYHIDMPSGNRKKTVAITIHNTGAISVPSNTTPAEQYVRATVNGNMNDVRVHFYVDDVCAWQSLPFDWVNWSCADGCANPNSGNNTSIAIEVIGNSAKAEANAVKLTAYLLKKYNLNVDNGLRTHTYWLNIKDGKTGTIDYLNTAHNDYKMCLPLDSTELLTPKGWKRLENISVEDTVAQYDNGIITFVHPEAVVEPYVAKTLKTRYLEATPNHRMLVKSYQTKNDVYSDKLWGDILSKTSPYKMHTSGLLEGELNISDDELLLLAWIQGDGHYMKDKNDNIMGLEFHLKKKRKIERICQLLDELQIKYTQSWCQNDSVHIRVYNKKICEWAEKWLENKEFSYKLLPMSQEQFNLFIDELKIIDGHKNERQEIYTSASTKNLDFIQALCATHNKRASQCTLGSSRKLYGDQPVCVNFLKTNASFCKNDNIVERETRVSCVSVPSTYILIRQNNHTFIVGNCPLYILPHWSTFKSSCAAALKNLGGGTTEQNNNTSSGTLYRIRKSWTQASTQIGAYSSLENAKKAWKEGYTIYDNNGKAVYPVATEKKEEQKSSTKNINITYRVRTSKWLSEITNCNDTSDMGYAGIDNVAATCLVAKVSEGTIRYRVHVLGGGWLGWITAYNINDWYKGYAGLPTQKIDAIQAELIGVNGYDIQYRTSSIGQKNYYSWVTGLNDYAGVFGRPVDKIQMKVIKK